MASASLIGGLLNKQKYPNMMDDLEPFESPLLLIGAAKENLVKFESGCVKLRKDGNYRVHFEVDAKTGENVIKARLNYKIPGQLRVLCSSIINDLRHALDQAVCDGAIMLGASNTKNTYFPFAKDLADFDIQVRDKCKKVRADLVNFIKDFKPYNGGDDLLWAINRISGKAKHERIIEILPDPVMTSEFKSSIGSNVRTTNIWNPRKNEFEFMRLRNMREIKMDFTLSVQVIIGPADIVGGQPAIGTLKAFLDKAESIVLAIKAEAERLSIT